MDDKQRSLAVRFYNQTWDLIDQTDRSPEERRRMVTQAMASRALWDDIGGPEQWITGDWQIAHVASLAGYPNVAIDFATSANRAATEADVPTWLLASTCEGLARAYGSAGDAAKCTQWRTRAEELLQQVDDAEDRAVIEQQLATITVAG
jgi:hypothetical protein